MPKTSKKSPTKAPLITSRGLEHLAFGLGHGGGGIAPMRLLPDLDLGKKNL